MLSGIEVRKKPRQTASGRGAKASRIGGAGRPVWRWTSVSLLLAMACGGCSDAIIVHADFSTDRDVQNHLAYATDGHPMRTLVKGNPFPGPMEGFVSTVTSAMSGANPGRAARFSADPNEPNLKPYLVVMQFNPSRALRASELCAGNARGDETPSSGKVSIAAGFCFGDDALSEARAEVSGVSGPDDPRFRQAVQDVTYFLFPPDEPQGESDAPIP